MGADLVEPECTHLTSNPNIFEDLLQLSQKLAAITNPIVLACGFEVSMNVNHQIKLGKIIL